MRNSSSLVPLSLLISFWYTRRGCNSELVHSSILLRILKATFLTAFFSTFASFARESVVFMLKRDLLQKPTLLAPDRMFPCFPFLYLLQHSKFGVLLLLPNSASPQISALHLFSLFAFHNSHRDRLLWGLFTIWKPAWCTWFEMDLNCIRGTQVEMLSQRDVEFKNISLAKWIM
jgi:hypothetical protein